MLWVAHPNGGGPPLHWPAARRLIALTLQKNSESLIPKTFARQQADKGIKDLLFHNWTKYGGESLQITQMARFDDDFSNEGGILQCY